jgi:hypothetical protein
VPGESRRRRLLEEDEGGGWQGEVGEAGAEVLDAEAEVAEKETAGAVAVEQGGEEKAAEEEERAGMTRVALTSAGLSYVEQIALGVDPDLVLQQLPVPLTTHRMQFFPADYFNSSQLKCASRAARALAASKRKHLPACPPVIKLCRFGLAHSQLYCCSTRMLASLRVLAPAPQQCVLGVDAVKQRAGSLG